MAEQGYNLKYTGAQIDTCLDKANGIPAGGSTGQVLTKKSGTNYDFQWTTPSGGGGTGGGGTTASDDVLIGTITSGKCSLSGSEIQAAVNANKKVFLHDVTNDYWFHLVEYTSSRFFFEGPSTNLSTFGTGSGTRSVTLQRRSYATNASANTSISNINITYYTVPAGGSKGQILAKSGSGDGATTWIDPPSGATVSQDDNDAGGQTLTITSG